MKSPIFIFSLPRAGSTLLQRVLMAHKDICSVSEPWLLLPHIYASKRTGSLSEYSSATAHIGIDDFIKNLPNGKKDYEAALRNFILELYSKQCKEGEVYFLDKTPRYYLIIDEIVEVFPNAKFIFLFRNPIQILASIVNTWGNNRFNKLISNYYDITNGMTYLSDAFIKHKERSYSLNYENFVQNPNKELVGLFEYLELEFDQDLSNDFNKQDTKGRLGDPTGVLDYSKISSSGLHKWKETFNSFVRKKIALRILNKINETSLEIQGYNKMTIRQEIKSLNNKKNALFLKDTFDYFTSYIVRKYNINLLIDKNFLWIKTKHMS